MAEREAVDTARVSELESALREFRAAFRDYRRAQYKWDSQLRDDAVQRLDAAIKQTGKVLGDWGDNDP